MSPHTHEIRIRLVYSAESMVDSEIFGLFRPKPRWRIRCNPSKGCFWCKMMRGIQKSWSQCSTMLTFWEIKSFLKKWLAEICGKKQQNHLFQKNRNFAKSKRCRVLGPTFLDSSLHFTSKTLIIDWKNSYFQFFHSKGTFLPLLSQQPWPIL